MDECGFGAVAPSSYETRTGTTLWLAWQLAVDRYGAKWVDVSSVLRHCKRFSTQNCRRLVLRALGEMESDKVRP